MKSFWHELPRPFYVLAPMESVTDVVFRHVVTKAGRPDVYMTEFTNATGWHRAGDRAIGGRLIKTDDEKPIVAQIWGSDVEAMRAMSHHCRSLGYDGIDLNMGCPDQSAIKAGGGADMIRNPDRAVAVIEAAKSAGLPVSVKTRLGYTAINEWSGWITTLLRQNLAALTIHLRTKKEMSKVPAHWELIPEIIALRDRVAPETLIIINGDIRDRQHGKELYDLYGVDGIMIGRGIFTNPYAFSERREKPTRIELLSLLHGQLTLYDIYQPQMGRSFETLKRFFKIYIRDFEGAAELRNQLMQTSSTEDVRSILSQLKQ